MRLFRWLYGLTVFDVAATAAGYHMRFFAEANPVLAPLFERHVLLGASVALTVSVLSVAAVQWLCRRRPRLVLAAWGLLGVKVWVAGMHVAWIVALWPCLPRLMDLAK